MNMDMTIGNATRKEFIDAGTLKEIEAAAGLTPAVQEAKGNGHPVTTAAEAQATTMFRVKVSDLQADDVTVNGYKISGTLYKQTEGDLVDAWGEGYFLAVNFSQNIPVGATKIMVGMDPSYGNGLADATLDPDKNGAFKVTDPKTQKFVIETTTATETRRQEFDLSGIKFADKPAVNEG